MKRTAISVGLIGACFFAITLSVWPQLHERFHPDAKQRHHECAVTLIAAGNYHHAAPPPLVIEPVRANEFSGTSALTPIWVQSPFLSASVFEHAPPQNS